MAGAKKRVLPLAQVYGLLEPGPVVLVTTARAGRVNIMTLSWHTMMDFEPPIVGCVISNRNYSFEILNGTEDCVINIPTVELAEKVVGCGNTSGRRVDKFKTFGLTPVAAAVVKPPLIAECYAHLECKVIESGLPRESTRRHAPSSGSSGARPYLAAAPTGLEPRSNSAATFTMARNSASDFAAGRLLRT